ncbi:MAG TPA: hypothetical protein VLX90_03230 [Steroidobacteraceae bacterium]|nr:hypothetical protein [Steroidobacteraceae bacterium]
MLRTQHTLAYGMAASISLALSLLQQAHAAPADDPYAVFDSIPTPPSNLAAAQQATTTVTTDGGPALVAPACEAFTAKLTAAMRPSGSVAGIDMARASSDPAYAAQVQARMQGMSMADKMAMAQQMASAHSPSGASGNVAAFIAQQRSADSSAQQKIRELLDGALGAAGARHREVDAMLNGEAKSCPQDKTGWPLEACTRALGTKSIAQHRAIEAAALGSENQAFAQARAIALAQVNKGRDLFSGTRNSGDAAAPLAAWVLSYAQLLQGYGEAITLRAGFWSHAEASHYTGQVRPFIALSSDKAINWPLSGPPPLQTGL